MWKELWQEHRGAMIGVMAGLLLGFVYLLAGFWHMLMFAAIVFISFLIGKHYQLTGEYVNELAERLIDRFRK